MGSDIVLFFGFVFALVLVTLDCSSFNKEDFCEKQPDPASCELGHDFLLCEQAINYKADRYSPFYTVLANATAKSLCLLGYAIRYCYNYQQPVRDPLIEARENRGGGLCS
jgi:hypothetical protein